MTWRLHVLGASSTQTPPGDSNASLALSNGKKVILIDAGGNLPAKFNRANLDVDLLTDVIITHSHPDHTYGLPFLSHSFYHGHGEITCWTTSEALPRLKENLEAYDLQQPDRYLTVEFNEVATTNINSLDLVSNLEVRAFPTKHSRESFGLSIEGNNRKIVFSGDTTLCESLHEIGETADILIHDCQGLHGYKRYFEESHTSAKELGQVASELNVSLLVPFHHNLIEIPGGWEEIGSELRECYRGNIIYPTAGMGFIL